MLPETSQPSQSRVPVDLRGCQLACETAGEAGALAAKEHGWGWPPAGVAAAMKKLACSGDSSCRGGHSRQEVPSQPAFPACTPLSNTVCTSFQYNEISKRCELRSGECPFQQQVSPAVHKPAVQLVSL